MNYKKILNIDMDGVTCDFDKKFMEYCPSLFLGENGNDADYDARSKLVDEVILGNPGFFQQLEPIDGAIEAIKLLSDYYDIQFVSTPVYAVAESYSDKRIWLEKHFGDFAKKKLVLTHRKDLVIGDYLIDDRIKNGVATFKGEHIHFGQEKFANWKNVLDYLIPKTKKLKYFIGKNEHEVNVELGNLTLDNTSSFPRWLDLDIEMIDKINEHNFLNINDDIKVDLIYSFYSGKKTIVEINGRLNKLHIDIDNNIKNGSLKIFQVIYK